MKDDDEIGVPGVIITKSGGQTATTDSVGKYAFHDLVQASHTFTATPPDGYRITSGHPFSVGAKANSNKVINIALETISGS